MATSKSILEVEMASIPIENIDNARPLLGEFEQAVMVAVKESGSEAYGLRLAGALLKSYGGKLAVAQVYVTLNRLEAKGFLSSRTEPPLPIRGGRARRVFSLEGNGARALEQSMTVRYRALASSGQPPERGAVHDETKTREDGPHGRGHLVPAFG